MKHFLTTSGPERRIWHADDPQHAIEQHCDLLPDDPHPQVRELRECPHPDTPTSCETEHEWDQERTPHGVIDVCLKCQSPNNSVAAAFPCRR